jgi:hypothetical protein
VIKAEAEVAQPAAGLERFLLLRFQVSGGGDGHGWMAGKSI